MNELVTKNEPDWSAIEVAYRSGDTLRAIANKHGNGLSHVAISNRAKKDGWARDLGPRIKAKTEEKVCRDALNKSDLTSRLTEQSLIEANAELQANVIRAERKDITRYRGLVSKLFTELETTTDGLVLMEQIGELMSAPDEAGVDKLNEIYRKVISLPGRVDMAKKLVETLEKLINAERRVFNIKDDDQDKQPSTVVEIKLVALAAAVAK